LRTCRPRDRYLFREYHLSRTLRNLDSLIRRNTKREKW